ncbi:hypothetical protein [Yinghuangia sp. YIM S09857]|uniref:hypothetical protein n=1 Tax=Yinghuangia sp. YIM S09857 TaxID=3436929 RepID=UPI003F53ACA9
MRRRGSVKGLLIAFVVCLPVAWLFVQLTLDVPVRSVKAVAAANDHYGERGTVTVTHRKVVNDSSGRKRHCHGEFRPRGGGTVVPDVRVRMSGDCTVGRTLDARLLRQDDSWLIPQKDPVAYAGSGAGEAITVGVFIGLFCLIVGAPFVAAAVGIPVLVVAELWHRRRGLAEPQLPSPQPPSSQPPSPPTPTPTPTSTPPDDLTP